MTYNAPSGGTAVLTRNGAAPVGEGEYTWNVLDFGAQGDGVTNDNAAITAAIAAATASPAALFGIPVEVFFPYTTGGYASSALAINAKNRVRFRGAGYVSLKRTGAASAAFLNIVNANDIRIEGITWDDSANLTTSAVVRVFTNNQRVKVIDCKFFNVTTALVHPVEINSSVNATPNIDCSVEECRFDTCTNNIRVTGAAVNIDVYKCKFTAWMERCIYVNGDATNSTNGCTIRECYIEKMAQGGSIRQAIVFESVDSNPHLNCDTIHNKVYGINKSYNDPTTPGGADQISYHRVKGGLIAHNTSWYGGDTGITVALQCTDIKVIGNDCQYNDTVGISCGSSITTALKGITLTANTLKNNGQNRNADRSATGRVGLYMYGLSDSVATGNTFADDQGTPTQLNGTYRINCTNVKVGGNIYANGLGDNIGTGNTNVGEGFYATAPQVKLAVTGAKAGNAALTSLLSQLAALGILTDSST